jgi:hypothetical protein
VCVCACGVRVCLVDLMHSTDANTTQHKPQLQPQTSPVMPTPAKFDIKSRGTVTHHESMDELPARYQRARLSEEVIDLIQVRPSLSPAPRTPRPRVVSCRVAAMASHLALSCPSPLPQMGGAVDH